MPNIEIHGLDSINAKVVKKRINSAMLDNGFGSEAVTTICEDVVENCHGEAQPFLRICSSDYNGEYIAEIIKEENVLMDIELVHIDKFIPAKR